MDEINFIQNPLEISHFPLEPSEIRHFFSLAKLLCKFQRFYIQLWISRTLGGGVSGVGQILNKMAH